MPLFDSQLYGGWEDRDLEFTGLRVTSFLSSLQGVLFEEVQQTFTDWVQQNIRVYKDRSHVEFDYIIGPIPFE